VYIGTLDEVDFCAPVYPVRHIFSIKREGASEGIYLFIYLFIAVVRDKNG
jgi:hypothetical protein